MTAKEATTVTSINFHFDPLCPLAWRTALWIREVRKVRPVDVTWRFFSLEVVNRKEGVEPDFQGGYGWAGLRKLALARRHMQKAGLDASMVDAALADERTLQDVLADHEEAVQRYRAFGVPTIAIEGLDVGFYGPIIHFVPRGEDAGELWDYTAWALRQPNLFELKRDRAAVRWEPIEA